MMINNISTVKIFRKNWATDNFRSHPLTLLRSDHIYALAGGLFRFPSPTTHLSSAMNTGTPANTAYFNDDAAFNALFPAGMRSLAVRHWTPVHIAKLAAGFLAAGGGHILDIGSGIGKFCLAGAHYAPHASFTGIEQRKHLVAHALHAQKVLGMHNVSFIHGNFTELNMKDYDHFYFFNAFFENIDRNSRIDEKVDCSEVMFEYYLQSLYAGLQQMPVGTRVATYHAFHGEIPASYEMVALHHGGDLAFWIKRS